MAELDVRRLALLAEVAGEGSISAAAKAAGYTPSAVSQQIAKLEREAGQPLLERHARGISLTDGGRALVGRAGRIANEIRAARAELDEIAGLRSGSVRLGSFPTASASLLPLAVKGFGLQHPDITVSVRSALRAELLEMLHVRDVELALLWDYDWDRIEDSSLELLPLIDDPTALLVSAGHRLADRSAVPLEELAREQWVTRADDHPLGDVLRRVTARAGAEPQITFEAHDYHEVQAMVAVGLGVALAPRTALTNLREDVRVIDVSPGAPVRRIMLARLADRRLTPAEEGMRSEFITAAAELAATFR
ncbi:MAG TPA: LysR family transcriptional regulator [Flexivirga sp.]|uniref:LysR family transcriptional regulator n=1 Tax=Flexivirga sp. TaxID=1962927 RepID=UPI002BAA87A5|nr:LysR family transcriptional regulator [Flexivirga sp.]HWC21627.1 LysR family transcriptional regulator [Flexivirga sp.]